MKQKQADAVLSLVGDVYGFENFRFSKKVSFLLEKSSNRLEPSSILASFDQLK